MLVLAHTSEVHRFIWREAKTTTNLSCVTHRHMPMYKNLILIAKEGKTSQNEVELSLGRMQTAHAHLTSEATCDFFQSFNSKEKKNEQI